MLQRPARLTNLEPVDRRESSRKSLRLATTSELKGGEADVIVSNLSTTGMLLTTDTPLAVGDVLTVELPGLSTEARVVRCEGATYGCQFSEPVPVAVVAASHLESPTGNGAGQARQLTEEIAIGVRPTIEELEAWKIRFLETRKPQGWELGGFRQDENGMIFAIVTRRN